MIRIKNRSGYLFTISTIILIIPLVYLISYYGGVQETQLDDTLGRIRCDELHYYVEDVKRDMGRAVEIFGRRAASYAIDNVVNSFEGLEDYKFNCTSRCGVDCSEFSFETNGSEAAIAELILCGTLHGRNVSAMVNHTLPLWIEKMREEGARMNFEVDISAKEIHIIPIDAWNFAVMVDNKVSVRDRKGLCYYTENIITVHSNSSIIGLPDPQYVLNTKGNRRPIQNCTKSSFGVLENLVGSASASGEGSASGTTFIYSSNIGNVAQLINYCNTKDPDELSQEIFVMDIAGGIVCNSPLWRACFNATSPRHFAAVIDYGPANTCDMCPGMVPRICDTGSLNLPNGDCIMIISNDTCVPPIHAVVMGLDFDSLNTSCYYVSDVSGNYDGDCGFDTPNGGSFFDRLDGNMNLSEKYVNQSLKYFNNPLIGMESFVSLHDLSSLKGGGHDVKVNFSSTWVDYLYWQDVGGCGVMAFCGEEEEKFKLDCAHAHGYRIDTSCESVTGCPRCPVTAALIRCGMENPPGSGNYDVKFTLQITDVWATSMDLLENPVMGLEINGNPSSFTMDKVVGETGKYEHIETGLAGNDRVKGNVTIREIICPLVENSTDNSRITQPGFNHPSCP